MSHIEMNPGWEEELKKAVAPKMQEIARRLQAALDRVSTEYSGKPVEEVKPALARAWADATPDGSITDPELTTAAEGISKGGRLRLEGGKLVLDGVD